MQVNHSRFYFRTGTSLILFLRSPASFSPPRPYIHWIKHLEESLKLSCAANNELDKWGYGYSMGLAARARGGPAGAERGRGAGRAIFGISGMCSSILHPSARGATHTETQSPRQLVAFTSDRASARIAPPA